MLSETRGVFRKYQRLTFAIVALLAGIVFTVVGIISIVQLGKAKVEVTATITKIEVVPPIDSESDETYDVYVSYTDADGAAHSDVLYPSYKSGMKVGDEVQAFYDAEKPDTLVSNGKVTPFIFLGVGILAIAGAVFIGFKTLTTSLKDENDLNKVKSEQITEENVQKALNPDEQPETYYFHFTGKLNQSYVLETKDKKPVMEARCDKMGIVSKFKFTFINHLNGQEVQHEVSHTSTTSYGGYADKSSFKIDGVLCWDHIANLGYSLDAHLQDITHFNYDVSRYGVNVGQITSAGRNVMKEGKQDEENTVAIQGCYVVSCRPSDVEGFFAACFTLSRVEIAY